MTEQLTPLYVDHAATTAVRPDVLAAMLPYFAQQPGNPSSPYRLGQWARRAVDRAREQVAACLGAEPHEIVFTSGGTESDNAAIKGLAFAARAARGANHVVTTQVEHHAVLHTCRWLEQFGFETTYLPVDARGQVAPADVAAAITERTALVAVMYANNEVGTIQPIRAIADITRRAGVPLHTDAVQAAGALDLDVDRLGVDTLAISAHKFYGPKGTGALYVRSGTAWQPQQQGGAQERNRRAGTENTAGIVGLATALELATATRQATAEAQQALRDRLLTGISGSVPQSQITGHATERLPNNASFCFAGVEGESLLMRLEARGIYASSGSACASGALEPSHVLLACGLPPALARGSLRLTIGTSTTAHDVERLLEEVPAAVAALRRLAPVQAGAAG